MHTSIKEQIPENSVMYTNIQVSKIQRYMYIIYFKCLNSGYCDWKPHASLWPTHQLSPTISAVSPLYDTLFMSKHSRRACEHLKMNWQKPVMKCIHVLWTINSKMYIHCKTHLPTEGINSIKSSNVVFLWINMSSILYNTHTTIGCINKCSSVCALLLILQRFSLARKLVFGLPKA